MQGCLGAVAGAKGKIMSIRERISLPSKGLGHGMRRKEWEKEKPLKEQVRGGVWRGLEHGTCLRRNYGPVERILGMDTECQWSSHQQ